MFPCILQSMHAQMIFNYTIISTTVGLTSQTSRDRETVYVLDFQQALQAGSMVHSFHVSDVFYFIFTFLMLCNLAKTHAHTYTHGCTDLKALELLWIIDSTPLNHRIFLMVSSTKALILHLFASLLSGFTFEEVFPDDFMVFFPRCPLDAHCSSRLPVLLPRWALKHAWRWQNSRRCTSARARLGRNW